MILVNDRIIGKLIFMIGAARRHPFTPHICSVEPVSRPGVLHSESGKFFSQSDYSACCSDMFVQLIKKVKNPFDQSSFFNQAVKKSGIDFPSLCRKVESYNPANPPLILGKELCSSLAKIGRTVFDQLYEERMVYCESLANKINEYKQRLVERHNIGIVALQEYQRKSSRKRGKKGNGGLVLNLKDPDPYTIHDLYVKTFGGCHEKDIKKDDRIY